MTKKTLDLKKVNRYSILISYIFSIMITAFVYFTGGTSKVYANLIYIPIALISSTNGKKIGVIHAIISSLLVGPLMPLDTGLNLTQNPINWIIRLIIYTLIAYIIGFFADYNRENKEYITNLLTYDMITNFKNIESLKKDENPHCNFRTVIALSVKEYEEILSFFGYNFTNNVILRISQELKRSLNEYNNIDLYKYDGMEFILIINHNNYIEIDEIINILKHLNKSTVQVDSIPIYIEIVIGMAKIDGKTSALEGLRQALLALRYAVDNDIKFTLYERDIDIYYKNAVNIASNFKTALGNNNIKTAYQNIYDTNREEVYGVELLSRWITKNGKQVYPDEFIPIIEKTELINELSKYMIDKAIEYLISENFIGKVISINFSPKDFNDETVDYLVMKIKNNNIGPGQLQLEITEDILINKDETKTYLERIKKHGVTIAIDDFGTGYASYQYISELPIDIIKIDKSIINKVDKSPLSRSIVKSVVDFCKTNDLKTVAEGVETQEIVNICKELNIDLLQGYYYHKPTIIE